MRDTDQARTLQHRLTSIRPHIAQMFVGAFMPLENENNPMRFVQAAHSLREVLRELLAHYAPDESIRNAVWFEPDESAHSGITRRHRVIFAAYSYVDPELLDTDLDTPIRTLVREISNCYGSLSNFAHPREETLSRDESSSLDLFDGAIDLFLNLLDTIEATQRSLYEEIQSALTPALDSLFFNETFDELDELSTHTRADGVWDVEPEIDRIEPDKIYFSGSATISCELQWGSNSDIRNDDGFEASDSFPFTFEGTATTDALKLEVERHQIKIDNSSFFE